MGKSVKNVKEVWSKDIIDTFYSVNPLWVKLVNKVYGSIKNNYFLWSISIVEVAEMSQLLVTSNRFITILK